MKTATISKPNHLTSMLLGLLALAAPTCLSNPADDGEPGGSADVNPGTRVAVCGSGTTCTATIPASTGESVELVAFISANSTDLPPANAQAASNIVFGLFVIG